jgi:hypothetical protein
VEPEAANAGGEAADRPQELGIGDDHCLARQSGVLQPDRLAGVAALDLVAPRRGADGEKKGGSKAAASALG